MHRLAWCCLLFALSCDKDATTTTPASASATVAGSSEPLEKGNEIVAALSSVSFREGRVLEIQGDNVVFEYGRPDPGTGKKPQQTVPRARVWRVGQNLEAAPGDALVCRVASGTWLPCKVEARQDGAWSVVDSFGKTHQLKASELVRPDAATVTAIQAYLEREAKHRSFDQAFEAAGKPARAADWRPQKGDAVVVHFVGISWYGATVIEVLGGKDKVRIQYEGKVFPDRDVPLSAIAPQPRTPAEVAAGSFVLVKPKDKSGRWEHAKVVSVDGAHAEVVSRTDEKRKVERTDLVPIVK
ncbi:MAG TPA: hypothetical protein VFB62_22835 [Polyangiaceae bacterium]|jgi:hypothetical protein|nr:hypothetical protein [Polyangiaceae bacterium]